MPDGPFKNVQNISEKKDEQSDYDIPEYYTKENLVFGCGNILFGDDGFGPRTIEYYLTHFVVPDNTYFLDVGTGIRNLLFDIVIAEKRPKNIIIVDSMDLERKGGEIFEIEIEAIPINKINDFSVHQVPTINLLKELRDYCSINVVILVCQIEKIPEEVNPGLSETLETAIPQMCDRIREIIEKFE
jgi:coenzyme F420 hydrogenase subunit delta